MNVETLSIAPGPDADAWRVLAPRFSQDSLIALGSLHKRFGDVVSAQLSGRLTYSLISPKDVRYVLQENAQNYVKHLRPIGESSGGLFGEGLVVRSGERARQRRRLMHKIFAGAHWQRLLAISGRRMERQRERWAVRARSGAVFDILFDTRALTFDILAEAVFGEEAVLSAGLVDPHLRHAYEKALTSVSASFDVLGGLSSEPQVARSETLRDLDEIIYSAIDHRRRRSEQGPDLLSFLLNAADPETGQPLTDVDVRDEVITILVAGQLTTANHMAWTYFLLAQHPAVDDRVRQELQREWGRGDLPPVERLKALDYTTSVVLESLRLYPPFWVISRTAVSTDKIGGFAVPAGTQIVLSPALTHRDPRWWPDPDQFEPERFRGFRFDSEYRYFPFGGGQHLCIGNNFAVIETLQALAATTPKYRLRLRSGSAIQPMVSAINLFPRGGVPATVEALA